MGRRDDEQKETRPRVEKGRLEHLLAQNEAKRTGRVKNGGCIYPREGMRGEEGDSEEKRRETIVASSADIKKKKKKNTEKKIKEEEVEEGRKSNGPFPILISFGYLVEQLKRRDLPSFSIIRTLTQASLNKTSSMKITSSFFLSFSSVHIAQDVNGTIRATSRRTSFAISKRALDAAVCDSRGCRKITKTKSRYRRCSILKSGQCIYTSRRSPRAPPASVCARASERSQFGAGGAENSSLRVRGWNTRSNKRKEEKKKKKKSTETREERKKSAGR